MRPPDFFLYDSLRRLAYHGRLDDSTPGNGIAVTGREMRLALDAVLEGLPSPAVQNQASAVRSSGNPLENLVPLPTTDGQPAED